MAGVPEFDAVTVLVADDEAMVRDAIRALLEDDPRFRVVASVGSAGDAAHAAAEWRPSLAIIDVRMPGGGSTAVEAIRVQSPSTIVLACSSYDDLHTRDTMLRAGASTYVVKGVDDVLEAARLATGLAGIP